MSRALWGPICIAPCLAEEYVCLSLASASTDLGTWHSAYSNPSLPEVFLSASEVAAHKHVATLEKLLNDERKRSEMLTTEKKELRAALNETTGGTRCSQGATASYHRGGGSSSAATQ